MTTYNVSIRLINFVEFQMYLLLKWLHVLSAIFAVGANATYVVWLRLADQEKGAKPFALKGIMRLENVALPFYLFLLLSGLVMIFVSGIPWTTPWVLSSLILYFAMAFLGGKVFGSALRKQIELADKPQSAAYLAAEKYGIRVGLLILLIAVVIEYLMTTKPPLWG